MIQTRLLFRSFVRRSLSTGTSTSSSNEYDLICIGGGSGGLACAKEAADLGRRVALLDYVNPSPHGTKWGLGGTCVNVGCIPKKLMHQAGLIGQALKDAKSFGWELTDTAQPEHSWKTLVDNTQDYIRSLNWGYRVQLQEKKVDYFNAYGSFVDKNTIRVRNKAGKEKLLTGQNFVIAIGGRPKYPDIPGSDYGISSDDLFSLKESPGKTLVVGASYVALECAGFLASLNYPTDLMIRSIPLRGFDQQIAYLLVESLIHHKVSVLEKSVPLRVEKLSDGSERKFKVYFKQDNKERDLNYDTVLWAVGRKPVVDELGLEKAGVKIHESGKLVVDKFDRTNVPNIFAIGDVQHNRPELTPVAVMAGKLLAQRLFGNSYELMDYEKVPTTVFTPTEYGTVGLSEEACVERFGADNIEIFHAFYKPLEYNLSHRDEEKCYIKVICLRTSPRSVLGLHFFGPNAGEVVQGFATALRLNMTIEDLQKTIGIHPTSAEEIVRAKITKRSAISPNVTGC